MLPRTPIGWPNANKDRFSRGLVNNDRVDASALPEEELEEEEPQLRLVTPATTPSTTHPNGEDGALVVAAVVETAIIALDLDRLWIVIRMIPFSRRQSP
jgi:hypothetical protein